MEHHIIQTWQDFTDLQEYVKNIDSEFLTLDVETDSVIERKANLYGFAFCLENHEAFYLPIRKKDTTSWWNTFQENQIASWFYQLASKKKLIGHNAIYDILVLKYNWNYDLTPFLYSDTILQKHLLDEQRPFGLKEVAVQYLGDWANKAQTALYENIQANGGKTLKDNVEMYKADTNVLGEYCCFAPKSSLVSLHDGSSKYIENIQIGDEVLTHKGERKSVLSAFSREYKGDIFSFQVENGRMIKNVTPEHPFYVFNEDTLEHEWKKSKDLRVNDLLVKGEYYPKIKDTIESLDFWWLLGFYQAEGHISKRKNQEYVVLSMHQKESKTVLAVLSNLGLKGSLCNSKRNKGCQITICNSVFANKIKYYSGGSFKCDKKQISKESLDILCQDRLAALAFVAGYFDGDGNLRQVKDRANSWQLRCASTSASLINTLDLILNFLKLNSSRRDYAASGINRKHRFELVLFTSAASQVTQYSKLKLKLPLLEETFKKHVRIQSVQKNEYVGKVYNISVDRDQSYISNGIISHNCWDVLLTRKLFDIFEPKLKEQHLFDLFYRDEIMPLYKLVTIPMKDRGFPINVEHFKSLNYKISEEILNLETSIQKEIAPTVKAYQHAILDTKYPVKRTGNFPKYYAQVINFKLPEKNGKITLAKKELEKLLPENQFADKLEKIVNDRQAEDRDYLAGEHLNFLKWLLDDGGDIDDKYITSAQERWHFIDKPDDKYIFNLNSNNDLKWLFFIKLGYQALSKTEKGEPQVDEDFLESIKSKSDWVNRLIDYKKLLKLKSTYIEGILERHLDGVIYSSMKQFGPPSGRYASSAPNLQNLPRIKEEDSGLSELVLYYVNSIKKGFIAPKGYKLVNADYSQLEPRAFAEACGDPDLQNVFINGEDLYGAIAVRVFNLKCLPNEVKKKHPEYRQKAKVIALAIVYGAEAGRISQALGCDYQEAEMIIEDYLNAYPGLRLYMRRCDEEACTQGLSRTKFGRLRRVSEAQVSYNRYGLKLLDRQWAKRNGLEEARWKFKNALNTAKNHPIQGVAAHVVNRAMIAINKEFKVRGLDSIIIMTIHDEITCLAEESIVELVKKIVQDCMENTTRLSVPLKAEPMIGMDWSEVK